MRPDEIAQHLKKNNAYQARPSNGRPDERPEAREPVREEPRLQRRVKSNSDRLAIPQHLIPSGFSMEWKRCEVAGQEDNYYQADLRANHWEPVKADDPRFRDLAPYGQTSGPIRYGSLVLMMRPSYLCEEARDEEMQRNRDRFKIHARSIVDAAPGTFARTGHKELPSVPIRKAGADHKESLADYS